MLDLAWLERREANATTVPPASIEAAWLDAIMGQAFTMKRFMDEFNAAGLIPVSMLRWEMTGVKPPWL